MSVTKVINVEVQSGDINQLNSDLNKLDRNFKKVDNNAEKASSSLKDVGKNGGAIAVLDELTGGLATKTRDVAEATELFNFKLKGTRTALIATGIGAFVVALGLVVAYWDDIVEFITQANAKLEEQRVLNESTIGVLDSQLALLKEEEKFNKARGISNAENLQAQKDVLEEKKLILAENLKILESQLLAEESAAIELSTWQKLQIALGNIPRDLTLIDEEEQQRINDLRKAINELKQEQIRTEDALDPRPDTPTTNRRDRVTTLATGVLTNEQQKKATQQLQSQFEELFGIKKMQQQQLDDLGKAGVEESLKNINVVSAAQKKADDDTAKNKKILSELELALVADTVGQVANILGQNTAAGKAFGIASALINTYQGVTQVLKNETVLPEPFGTINKIASIGTVLSTGFQAVKDITSVQVPTQFGGSSGSGGGARGGASAPAFNVVGTSGVNQLAESLQQDQQPVQAFVVGSNVTSQQALDRNITETATLG